MKLLGALHGPPGVVDEVYCQLVKQTTRNASPASNLLGWRLLGVCGGVLLPSPALAPYLLAHCARHAREPGGVGAAAAFALGRLEVCWSPPPPVPQARAHAVSRTGGSGAAAAALRAPASRGVGLDRGAAGCVQALRPRRLLRVRAGGVMDDRGAPGRDGGARAAGR